MRIKFKKIYVENFKSIGTPIDFNYEDFNGLTFVKGINEDIEDLKNGVGKTTLLIESLMFGLYGRVLYKTRNEFFANRILKAKSKKYNHPTVRVEFEKDGDLYLIEQHDFGYRVWINGEEYTKSSKHETRKFVINEILNIPPEIFKNSILLTSSTVNNFFLMSKGAKRNYIETVFNFNVFGEMLHLIRKENNEIIKEIQILDNKLIQWKKELKKFQKENENFENNKKNKLKKLKERIKQEKLEYDNILIELTESENKEKEEFQKLKNKLEQEINEQTKQLNDIEYEIKSLKNSIRRDEKLIKTYGKILEIICEDCNKKIRNSKVLNFNINDIKEQINEKNNKILENHEKSTKINELLRINKEKVEDIDKKLKNFQKKELEVINNKKIKEKIKNNIKNLIKEIENIKNEQNPFINLIQNLEKEIEENTKLQKNFFNEKTKLDILEMVVSEDGAKRYLIKDIKDIMNILMRKYLNRLGADYSVIFDDKLDCTFLTPTGPCEYFNFSNGERKRINIALLFVFKNILEKIGNANTNLLVIDELIDEGIDDFAVNAVVEILKEEAKYKKVFLISHRVDLDNELFDNILTLSKKDGMTYIKEISKNEN